MRPIRYLILLLAIALALVLALLRPIQGGATHVPRKHHRAHRAKHVHARAPRRHRHVLHKRRPHHQFGNRIVSYARHFLGTPYSWGGSSPRTGFDCSGFVRYVYGHFGITLPHSTWGDVVRGRRVPRRWLRPGDLVFFSGASHVGIYVGSGRFIDAPHTGAVVRITTMHGWYGSSYYGARRLAVG